MRLSFMLEDDTEVGSSVCAVVPRVGEIVWLQCTTTHAKTAGLKDTQTSWKVREVAYWMADRNAGMDIPSDGVAVYVEPL